jgi:hypothetical protein
LHFIVIMAGAVLLGTVPASAQTSGHTHHFKPLPEVTVAGTVEGIRNTGCDGCEACEACSDCCGVHLTLRTASALLEVHLAPAWFLERQRFHFAPGDEITVTGTRITLPKGHAVVAREVTREGVVMKLRDEHNLPLWRALLTER